MQYVKLLYNPISPKMEYPRDRNERIISAVKEKKIAQTSVRLMQGDITTCSVDAVINVSGKTLIPFDLDEEPEAIPALLDRQPGEAPLIESGSEVLKAEQVIHAPTVDTTATAGALKIRKSIRAILEQAQQEKLTSLALPPIGSGINRYPLERCAEILLEELYKSVSQPENSIEKVIFVLKNQKSYRIFEQVLEQFEEENDVD